MNAALQVVAILAGFGLIGVLLRAKRRDPWETCRPPTNLEREINWINRYAAPWEADERKARVIQHHRRNNALDQRVARMARARP